MIPQRLADELCYHLDRAGETERLARSLARIPVFLSLFKGASKSEVYGYWRELAHKNIHAGELYRQELDRYERTATNAEMAEALLATGLFLEVTDSPGTAEELIERLLKIEGLSGKDRLGAEQSLAWLAFRRGSAEDSMRHLERARRVAEEIGDKEGEAAVLRGVGNIHAQRGELEQALEFYELSLRTAEAVGDVQNVSSAIGSIGNVQGRRGELQKAIEHHERHLALAEEMRDREGIATASSNLGNAHYRRGDLAEALDCYRRSVAIAQELGVPQRIAIATGNMATVYNERGDFDRAIQAYQSVREVAERIGDRYGVADAIGGIGTARWKQGDLGEALRLIREAVGVGRELGIGALLIEFLPQLTGIVLDIVKSTDATPPPSLLELLDGATNWREAAVKLASSIAAECSASAETLGAPELTTAGALLTARCLAAAGDAAAGAAVLRQLLEQELGDDCRAEVLYWLASLGTDAGIDAAELSHLREQGIALHTELYQRVPRHDVHARLDQLRAAHRAEETT